MITEVLKLGNSIIDKLFPDPVARENAKIELLKAEQNGELEKTKQHLSVILAEAKSNDPWTSRARPSFLYVMYCMILFSIPLGIIHALDPTVSTNIIDGITNYLGKIPENLYDMMSVCYLGYTAGRSFDKYKINKN